MADNILPVPHRGDPDPRRMALTSLGFQWRAGLWRRGHVALSDADIDALDLAAPSRTGIKVVAFG
jgi:hypothetical protein